MRRRESGFTIVEMLTVVGILALLVGLLIPALTAVKKSAKETKQKAQLTTIELALVTFKNDYGDYPASDWTYPVAGSSEGYCGAQKLSEALVGWDLLGFHPKSGWRADGLDEFGSAMPSGLYIYSTLTHGSPKKGAFRDSFSRISRTVFLNRFRYRKKSEKILYQKFKD